MSSTLLWELGNSGLNFRPALRAHLISFWTFCVLLCLSSLNPLALRSVSLCWKCNSSPILLFSLRCHRVNVSHHLLSGPCTASLILLLYLPQSLQSKQQRDLSEAQVVSCRFCALKSCSGFSHTCTLSALAPWGLTVLVALHTFPFASRPLHFLCFQGGHPYGLFLHFAV